MSWRTATAALVSLLVASEVGVRAFGLIDFPLYAKDADFGYSPLPNQSGSFMHTNRWVFNDRGMGIAAPFTPSARTDVLLIGNSVVLGGNNYDQPDKVAPQLQARAGASCAVWPVGAGGWTTINELRFLERNKDFVAGADFFIWEYMEQQMKRVNPWRDEAQHPTSRPLWATAYLASKVVRERRQPMADRSEPSAAAQAGDYRRFEAMLVRLAAASGRRPAGIVFLYPDRQQLAGARRGLEWLSDRSVIERMSKAHGLVLLDIARYPQWTDSMYRDSVHPTADGNRVLAAILADALRQATAGTCAP